MLLPWLTEGMRTAPTPMARSSPRSHPSVTVLPQALTCSGCKTAREGGTGSAAAAHKHQQRMEPRHRLARGDLGRSRGSRVKIPPLPLGCPSIDAWWKSGTDGRHDNGSTVAAHQLAVGEWTRHGLPPHPCGPQSQPSATKATDRRRTCPAGLPDPMLFLLWSDDPGHGDQRGRRVGCIASRGSVQQLIAQVWESPLSFAAPLEPTSWPGVTQMVMWPPWCAREYTLTWSLMPGPEIP